ncbi:hypothetical protein EDEG_03795 [Edhazardia aedis USNM 41457]|uniref:Small GTP-binding protein domain n=1 Tax=Edhazardia aedis (strain USNM 41457) TaxID=1003232 RepID=J8ZPQ0_EDHAE|nr:hypothetical protein EDEG_03795 [Edhazardia aedis USNM 41457]|eukprot:EJW01663.1 hypothetical protein EDEG_03795 [Edhazardia aedis USNM 41457]
MTLYRKYVFVGDKGVGKSSLLKKFKTVFDVYTLNTEFTSFQLYDYSVDEVHCEVEMIKPSDEITDIVYQKYVLEDAEVIFFCYDVSNIESFFNLYRNYQYLFSNRDPLKVYMLLGLKADKLFNFGTKNALSDIELQRFIRKAGIDCFLYVSAYNEFNLKKMLAEATYAMNRRHSLYDSYGCCLSYLFRWLYYTGGFIFSTNL